MIHETVVENMKQCRKMAWEEKYKAKFIVSNEL